MWIALNQRVAPGLEDAFQRLVRTRGNDLGGLGQKYGLRQMHVFQQGTQGFMILEVDDPEEFGKLTHDPDFQVLGQEMSSLMNFQPFEARQFWPEVFSWPPQPE